MKKIIAIMIVMAFIGLPAFSEEPKPVSNTSIILFSAVESNGFGFSYPAGNNFYIPLHGGWITWFYINGTTTTRYILQPTEISGKQLGIAYIVFGVWKSPKIFSQPGNISGNMLVLFGVVMQIE